MCCVVCVCARTHTLLEVDRMESCRRSEHVISCSYLNNQDFKERETNNNAIGVEFVSSRSPYNRHLDNLGTKEIVIFGHRFRDILFVLFILDRWLDAQRKSS